MKLTKEIEAHPLNGWPMLVLNLGLLLGGTIWLIYSVLHHEAGMALLGLFTNALAGLLLAGHFTIQPNEARVLTLMGKYKGTARVSGFHWTNPFYAKKPISLRARNLITEKIKV